MQKLLVAERLTIFSLFLKKKMLTVICFIVNASTKIYRNKIIVCTISPLSVSSANSYPKN